jgi:hypothetical protein
MRLVTKLERGLADIEVFEMALPDEGPPNFQRQTACIPGKARSRFRIGLNRFLIFRIL